MAPRFDRIYEDLKQDLQYIVEEYYQGNLSSAFGHFFLKMKFGLSNDEAYECMTDGFNDHGIDAIYTENNKTFHFFQFKFPEEISGISICKYSQRTGNTIENNFLGADSCVTLYENNIKNIWPDFKLKYKKTLSPFSDEKSIINSAFVRRK